MGMGVIIINGCTVQAFVNNETQFKTSVDAQFDSLDVNNDDVLSRSEMRKAFESMRSEMKKTMLAIAVGLGSSSIQMAVEDDDQSFLKKAADLEAAKISESS
uniref:EF-hand domain-containing protein n=1 Tax=Lactuca sativa TaxID=4236 RepID=A0A9R1W7N0_LACSA|nr:hypothetical protein LSAT_V11C300103430 [Lactuca sativa]